MDALKNLKVVSFAKKLWKQHETPQSMKSIEKANDRYTIKNMIMNVRLKTKMTKILNNLQTRKFKNLSVQLLKKINDKAYFSFLNSNMKENSYENILDEPFQIQDQDDDILDQNPIQIINIYRVLKKKIKILLSKIPIIDPNSLYKLIWDFFQSIIIVLLIIVVPIKLAVQDFCLEYYLGSLMLLTLIVVLIILDIFINLNTAFFRNGKIEVNRSQIVKNYLQQVGICDILIIFSLIYELSQTSNCDREGKLTEQLQNDWLYQKIQILLVFLLYIKIQKLHRYLFKLEETFSFKRRTLNILSLVKLLFFIINVAHAFSCLWLYIGRAFKQNSWLRNTNDGWVIEYVKSFYFITVTMTTIGYGDIIPTNVIESIVSIFSMLIACGVFGYTINSIGSIFLELKKEDEEKKENLFIINRYMNEKNISRELQSSIRENLEYYWNQWKDDNSEKEQIILQQLSEEMRQALLLQSNKIILEDCVFFQKNFSQEAIQKSVSIIKEKKLTPNEYIINSIEDVSKSGILFFVERGEVDIYQEFPFDSTYSSTSGESIQNLQVYNSSTQINQGGINQSYGASCQTIKLNKIQSEDAFQLMTQSINVGANQQIQSSNGLFSQKNEQNDKQIQKCLKHVCTIKRGQYFGEISFFTDFPNKFIAKSRNFSKILYIERSNFIEFLKSNHFQDDYETFCHIRDNINQNELSQLFQKCALCQNNDHNPITCPSAHFTPARVSLFYKHNFSQDIIERRYIVRRDVRKINCLYQLEEIYNCIERFLEKNENYIEQNIQLIDYSQSDISYFYDEHHQNTLNTIEDENSDICSFNQNNQHLRNKKNSIQKKPIFNERRYDESKDNSSNEDDQEENVSIRRISLFKQNEYRKQSIPKKQRSISPSGKLDFSSKQLSSFRRIQLDQSPKRSNLQSQNSIQLRRSSEKIDFNQPRTQQPFIRSTQNRNKTLRIGSRKKLTIIHSNANQINLIKKPTSQKLIEEPLFGQTQLPYNLREQLKKQKQKPSLKKGQDHYNAAQDYQNNSQQFDDFGINQQQGNKRKNLKQQNSNHNSNFRDSVDNQQDIGVREHYNVNYFNWDIQSNTLFDNMKIFKNYYPNYNHDKIIQKLKKKRIQENKLTMASKQSIYKMSSQSKENLFQIFKNQVNTIRYSQKLINSSIFSKREIQISPTSQIKNAFSISLTNPNEKGEEASLKEATENDNDFKIQNMNIKNIKFENTKSIFSQKNSLIISNFQDKIKNSLHEDTCFDGEDDFNIYSNRGIVTNKISINYKLNNQKSQNNENVDQNAEDRDCLSD